MFRFSPNPVFTSFTMPLTIYNIIIKREFNLRRATYIRYFLFYIVLIYV